MIKKILPIVFVLLFAFAPILFAEGDKGDSVWPVPDYTGEGDEGDSLWPVPDYTGDLKTRPALTGDWSGHRTKMAEKGITLSVNNVTTYQNILDGGRDEVDEVGGSLDYELHLDFQKMGLWPGAFVRLYAETQYGNFVNSQTGAALGVNLDGMLPLINDSTTTLTGAVFYQFLSENLGLFFGKVDTLDGDLNEFAHGRGNDQFLNQNLVFNSVTLLTTPVSAYGGGFIVILPGENNIFSVAVLDPNGQPDEWDLGDTFEDGALLSAEMRLEVNPFGQKGHQLFGGTYSTSDYIMLEQNGRFPFLRYVLTGDSSHLEKDESWCFYYNFDQYVYTEENDPRQGFGLFGRYGIADDKTSPIKQFFSLGIGGQGIIPGRDNDTFGIGYFYLELSDKVPMLSNVLDDSKGVEIFYNIEVTPWLHVTPDFQIIEPSLKHIDKAYIAGLRVKIDI
jgi:porin